MARWYNVSTMTLLSLLAHEPRMINYDYSQTVAAEVAPAFIAAAILFTVLALAVVYALHAFLLSRIFKKAGLAQWIAWVPFYSTWKFLELGGQPGFWAVFLFISPLNIVTAIFTYIAMYHIGLKLGKDGAWVVLGIFLPTVWLAILAFDNSKWHTVKK